MKHIREQTVVGTDGLAGEVVVVGLKFGAESSELLTWSLMNVAKPGDRVIALHVLETLTEFVGGTASLLSLVNTFDSLLAVYEGFCNLKQVDLKLKVCRGSSAKKILVREAKSSGAAKVILGTSKTSKIRSSFLVAKYCARKLPKSFSVFAVNSGKIIFQREASSPAILDHFQVAETLSQESENNLLNSILANDSVGNSLALVRVETSESVVSNSNSSLIRRQSGSKRGWSFLRRILLPRRRHTEKSHVKKYSGIKWTLKLPSWSSSSVVYPDQKQTVLCQKEDQFYGAIVPVLGSEVAWLPISLSHGSNGIPEQLRGLHEKYSSSCRLFSYQELCLATSNFISENVVGKGGSSHVYKGCLPDGKELAVKILKPSQDRLEEFLAEIEIITTLNHKNILSLCGFCFECNNLLLVYDFLSRGNLEENLHGNKKDKTAFGWRERYQVAAGVAEALDYLHNLWDQPVIHRDVKSSNILLSDDFEPQLSDFGLATWGPTSSSHKNCTDIAGTFGYLAPEYFMHGKVSDKVDVFAFGVVLLELLSGRMPITGESPKGQESLVFWAKPILECGKVSELLDPDIGSEYDDDDDDKIERMVLAATLCIKRTPTFRPQINVVLKLLQGDEAVTNWARKQVSVSKEVDYLEADEEVFPSKIQSYLNLALLDLEGDSVSVSSTEQTMSVENYLQGRRSRTSSFD